RRNLEVGRRILVTWLPRNFSGEQFTAPGGVDETPTRYAGQSEMDRPMLIQDRVGTAGIWRLTYQREAIQGGTEQVEEHFAVNPDPGEGALRRAESELLSSRLPPEADFEVLRSWSETSENVQDIRQGEVSALVLWIAFGLLILESLLSLLFGRRRAARRQPTAPSPIGEGGA
ncbi:MAG: hypothetical protein ACYTG6_11430, partial [Planctomycetota bacterium]